jgi:protocatechuate 3,4-dioxygenase beta subunit
MKASHFPTGRRQFLQSMAFATAVFTVPGVYAEELSLTPRQTEGPFYPDKLPLDTDNDLLILNDTITPAVGQVVHLGGKILSASDE